MGQRLGQHFLRNHEAVATSIDALNLNSGETVIEIGPGEGALTFPLLEACRAKQCRLIVIEKDQLLTEALRRNPALTEVEVIGADALRVLPDLISKKLTMVNYKLIGNIPYYITGSLLRLIGELEHKPETAVLMLQKEVAERVAARPPEMNLLAAATQIWGDIKVIMDLKPEDFDPPPEVSSAIISITPLKKALANLPAYYTCIKAVFKQPRKTLLNNVSEGSGRTKAEITDLLKKIKLSGEMRGQNLTIAELIELSELYPHIQARA